MRFMLHHWVMAAIQAVDKRIPTINPHMDLERAAVVAQRGWLPQVEPPLLTPRLRQHH